jgi:DNA polymerase-3 subunit beta
MKLTIQGGALSAAAAWAARIAPPPRTTAMPILTYVLLSAGEHGLECRATDFDLFGSIITEAQVDTPGKVAVPAHLLASITKTLRASDQISLELIARGVEMRVKRYKAILPVLGLEDWPLWPNQGNPIGTIPTRILGRGLARVLPAVSEDKEALPVLRGIEFEFGDTLTLAATDRYRIAAADLPWQPTLEAKSDKIIVPSELLATMRDAIADNGGGEGDVTLSSDGDTVTLNTSQHQITGRLIDGTPVKWRKLMAQPEPATTVTASVAALGRAVKQVSAAVEGKADKLRLEFTEDGIEVALADDPESSSDIIEPEDFIFTGEPLVIGVSGRYLRDALACVDTPMVQLRLSADPTAPFLLFAADEDGKLAADGYQHLLIALRLRELVAA